MTKSVFVLLGLLFVYRPWAGAAEPVEIRVDLDKHMGPIKPIWSYFGYDEPNYTYMPNGAKLVGELAVLHQPVYIRTHSLLSTGDGTPALKWGSTNAYTEDANGQAVYDWTIVDRIFDTYAKAHAKPFVEIGFMPKALSTNPDPYQHDWPKTKISAGWAYPPKDYAKWGELVYQWVRHSVARYGETEVKSWYWEVWNEPDIEYWRGTAEEYDKLYETAARAVKRALPGARVGGPATTSPSGQKAGAYLRQFLEYCDKLSVPLDFVTYHAKGRPANVDGHVQMGLGKNLADVSEGMKILVSFPKFAKLPIILSEADPEGCAACSVSMGYKQNGYRNGTLYPTYTAILLNSILNLADERNANIEGMLTWAFEFEGQPWFDGFRTLATNGVDKPVLNVFRMMQELSGDRVSAKSTGAIDTNKIIAEGVRGAPDVNALATRDGRSAAVMVWNYHDDDVAGPDVPVHLTIEHLPAAAKNARLDHYRIDQTHSNAYTAWQEMGKPQQPTEDQLKKLEAAGQLERVTPVPHGQNNGTVTLDFALPRQAVSLVKIRW